MTPDPNNEITIDVSQRPDRRWMIFFASGPCAGAPVGPRCKRGAEWPWPEDEWSWETEDGAWEAALLTLLYIDCNW